MNRNKTTIIGVAAVVLGMAVGLPHLFDARKKQPDDSFLAEALLSRMEADTTDVRTVSFAGFFTHWTFLLLLIQPVTVWLVILFRRLIRKRD